MNKLVVFDLDGTLVDSIADIAACMNYVFEKYNLKTFTVDEYRTLVGSGIRTVVEKTLPTELSHLIDELTAVYQPYYIEHGCDNSKPFEGVKELLLKLKQANVKIAVLSNKPHEQTLAVVKKLFGDDTFDLVWGHMDKFPRKPDPASLLALIEEVSSSVDQCIYVGDSNIDILVARNAGVTEAGVAWGIRPPDELYEINTKFVAQNMKELSDFLMDRFFTVK